MTMLPPPPSEEIELSIPKPAKDCGFAAWALSDVVDGLSVCDGETDPDHRIVAAETVRPQRKASK